MNYEAVCRTAPATPGLLKITMNSLLCKLSGLHNMCPFVLVLVILLILILPIYLRLRLHEFTQGQGSRHGLKARFRIPALLCIEECNRPVRSKHKVSLVCSGLMLVWRESSEDQMFRE